MKESNSVGKSTLLVRLLCTKSCFWSNKECNKFSNKTIFKYIFKQFKIYKNIAIIDFKIYLDKYNFNTF